MTKKYEKMDIKLSVEDIADKYFERELLPRLEKLEEGESLKGYSWTDALMDILEEDYDFETSVQTALLIRQGFQFSMYRGDNEVL